MGMKEVLLNSTRLALDTSFFIYAFEQHPQYGENVEKGEGLFLPWISFLLSLLLSS
jgi:hypothetical protein